MPKFCTKCGNPIEEGDAFCDVCGTPIPQTTTETQQAQSAPQPVYQQPVYQQPAAQQPAAKPPKSGGANKVLIAVIIVLAVAVVAVAVWFFVFKGNGGASGNDPQNGTTETTVSEELTEPETKEETEPETEEETEPETEEETEPETEEETEPTTEEETEPATEEETEPATASTVTVKKPTMDDFTWTIGGGGSAVPDGAKKLKKSEAINGEWKAFLDYATTGVKELSVVEIMAGDRAVTVEYKPYKIAFKGYKFKKSTDKTYSMDGAFDSGSIQVFNDTRGKLTIKVFYELGAKQYALGEMINPSGEKALVYLVR